MKRLTALSAIVMALQIAGCVPSLHPLYTAEDVVFDTALLGEWSKPGSEETFAFTKHGKKAYRVVYTDPDGQQGTFAVRLVELDGHRFLDFFPEREIDDKQDNVFYEAHLVPTHSFMRVEQITPTLQMAPLDPKWMDEFLKMHPNAIRHERTDDQVVLTAPTGELQAFVLEHLDTEDAWGKLSELSRRDDGSER